MIGDWVYNKFHERPIRITPYDFFTHGHHKDGGQYIIGEGVPAIGRDLEPIPLSPEILEKNGFLQNGVGSEELEELDADWTDDTYIWSEEKTVDDKTMVSVYIDYPKDECIFEAYTPKTHIDGIRIRYVHELQHALKLCQIEKEIQL